jgi:hypothetical protein
MNIKVFENTREIICKSRLLYGLKYGALQWDGKPLTELRADFTRNSYEAHRSTANRDVERERRTESMRKRYSAVQRNSGTGFCSSRKMNC